MRAAAAERRKRPVWGLWGAGGALGVVLACGSSGDRNGAATGPCGGLNEACCPDRPCDRGLGCFSDRCTPEEPSADAGAGLDGSTTDGARDADTEADSQRSDASGDVGADGADAAVDAPPPPHVLVTQIAQSGFHACALVTDGTVRCWGRDVAGELGTVATTTCGGAGACTVRPTAVPGITSAVQVAVTDGMSCARLADKTVMCWGGNSYGARGDADMAARMQPLAVAGLAGVEELALGQGHSCALLTGGTVSCWGRNFEGQLGDGSTNSRPTPMAVQMLTGVAQIACGEHHTCARLTTGGLACWGYNERGEVGDGTTTNRPSPTTITPITDARDIAATGYDSPYGSTCARLADGTARCWGDKPLGILGDGTTAFDRTAPVSVSGLTTATSIAMGGHACARLSDATLACWGPNTVGQLGDGTMMNHPTPSAVPSFAGVIAVTAGDAATCAIVAADPQHPEAGGAAYCWGENDTGGVGDGTRAARSRPTLVAW
jgi:alpha-tubulin suppressor-like RCC1 family protein